MNNEELIFEFESGEDVVSERLELAAERIKAIEKLFLCSELGLIGKQFRKLTKVSHPQKVPIK